jgi:hypothetical protein
MGTFYVDGPGLCGDGDATSGHKVMQYLNEILKDNDIATQEVIAG